MQMELSDDMLNQPYAETKGMSVEEKRAYFLDMFKNLSESLKSPDDYPKPAYAGIHEPRENRETAGDPLLPNAQIDSSMNNNGGVSYPQAQSLILQQSQTPPHTHYQVPLTATERYEIYRQALAENALLN